MMKRSKTISKHFFDDEILFKDKETGELHLKPGVKRSKFDTGLSPMDLESHINIIELKVRKIISNINNNKDWDD